MLMYPIWGLLDKDISCIQVFHGCTDKEIDGQNFSKEEDPFALPHLL